MTTREELRGAQERLKAAVWALESAINGVRPVIGNKEANRILSSMEETWTAIFNATR